MEMEGGEELVIIGLIEWEISTAYENYTSEHFFAGLASKKLSW